MNSRILPRRSATVALLGLALIAATAAFEKGASVWSKRNETSLLAEPKPLASPSSKVGFAEELKVDDIRGSWLHVKAAKGAGWVFVGNIAGEKPTLPPPAGLTSFSASETETSAAARPLTASAVKFAETNNVTAAQADVEWLDKASAGVKSSAVEAYLREHNLGEYKQ